MKFNPEQFKIILLWFVQGLIWCKQKVKSYRKKAMIKLVKWGFVKFILNKLAYRPYIKVNIKTDDIDSELYKDIQIISATNQDGKDIIDFAHIFFKFHDHNVKLLSRVYKYLYGDEIKSLKIKYKNCGNYAETYKKLLEEINNRDSSSSSDDSEYSDDEGNFIAEEYIITEGYMLDQLSKQQEIEVDINDSKYIKPPFSLLHKRFQLGTSLSDDTELLFGLILF